MFYEQFEILCRQQNTSPTAVTKKLGYSTSKVTAWKNGSIPKYEILQKIADYFNVPINTFFSAETDVNNIEISKKKNWW